MGSLINALILSAALDTNGQNARFVEASKRWGDDPTVTKVLALGNADPAGVVGRFARAAEREGGLRIREAHRASAYFDFPTDIVWDRSTEPLVRQLVAEADVIHLNNSYRAAQRFLIRKPMLLHHHGSLFRANPGAMLAVARQMKMLQAVSTIDLQQPAPELLHWLPSAYPIDELSTLAGQHREPADRVRIVHCPTNRAAKHTELLLSAVDQLRADGVAVELVLVEGRTWRESMAAKASADIVFDQLAYGYGCNSIEAWALGKPVISGADDWTLAAMRRTFGGRLPFRAATERSLLDQLRRMIASRSMREEYAARGFDHVKRWHDERPALARLAELYALTIAHYRAPSHRLDPPDDPVTFANPQGRRVWLDDAPIVWGPDWTLTTTDPYLIRRLRVWADSRPLWGIVEVRE